MWGVGGGLGDLSLGTTQGPVSNVLGESTRNVGIPRPSESPPEPQWRNGVRPEYGD